MICKHKNEPHRVAVRSFVQNKNSIQENHFKICILCKTVVQGIVLQSKDMH